MEAISVPLSHQMTSPLLKPRIIKVLLLDPLPPNSVNAFDGPNFEIDKIFEDLTEGELVKKVHEYQVICLR
jgi:hypothetical protein